MIIEWQSGKYLQPNTYISGSSGYIIGYSGVISDAGISNIIKDIIGGVGIIPFKR